MADLAPPRGMRDFYPEAMRSRNALFDAWRAAALRFGFQEYDACVVESLGLLKRKAGEEIVDQIYTFKDKSGRDLALRPEMTPSLARMVAARQGALPFPLKWFTIAQCFRYERMTRGRKREHYQWNLDVIGEDSVAAEAEVVATAIHALATLGLGPDNLRVRVNNRALLSELFEALGIASANHAAAFLALDKRGKLPDAEIRALLHAEGVDDATADRVFELMGIADMADAAGMLDSNSAACARLNDFMALMQAHGMADMITFDISVVRGLAYYTGIVFEAFDVNREFRAIFGGGRYDNLLGDVGGRPASGVGLGFGDVVVMEILAVNDNLPDAGNPDTVFVGYMNEDQRTAATRLAATLRAEGRCVDLALAPMKAKSFFSRADKGEFKQAVYIGPDDIQRGECRLKTLATRAERPLPLA